MELRQLRHAVAVAETLHFGRASGLLHMAQPALSRSIQSLEKELGAELFARSTRHVMLTPAGRYFTDEAREILTRLDTTAARTLRIAAGALGPFRLGITGSAAYAHLPNVIAALRADLPALALEPVVDLFTDAQEAALMDGSLDAGLLRLPISSGELDYSVFAREHLVLALPMGHRLDGVGSLSGDAVAQLRDEAFIAYGVPGSVAASAMLRTCQKAGFVPRRAHEASTTSTALALVAAGVGIAMLPESSRSMPFPGLTYVDLPDSASVDLALAWRRDDDRPMVRRFVEALADCGLIDPVPGLTEDVERTPKPLASEEIPA